MLCRNLKFINLSNLAMLTEDHAAAIVRGCKKLRRFYLAGCKEITPERLERLRVIRKDNQLTILVGRNH